MRGPQDQSQIYRGIQRRGRQAGYEQGYTVPDVATRSGVSAQSLYKWIKACAPDEKDRFEAEIREVRKENLKLKAELQRV